MFNNGDIMLRYAPIISSKQKELLQDISMLNSFYALCVNTVQMMYKYYTNENFRLDDDELEKSYNQLCGNEQSMMDAIHKNIRAIVYLAKGGSLPTNSHPNDISKLASYFLNNVLPQGQQFLSISQISEGHKTNAANRNLDLNMIGVHAYVSIEMFNCLADDALKMNAILNLLGNKEIPVIKNWLQTRKEIVKNNLNLHDDITNYKTKELLQIIQTKAGQTANQYKEQQSQRRRTLHTILRRAKTQRIKCSSWWPFRLRCARRTSTCGGCPLRRELARLRRKRSACRTPKISPQRGARLRSDWPRPRRSWRRRARRRLRKVP